MAHGQIEETEKYDPSCRYASVRTNLPREIMSFTDFPFVSLPGPHCLPKMLRPEHDFFMLCRSFV